MRVKTISGSVYEVQELDSGLHAKRLSRVIGYDIPKIEQFSKLSADKIQVGQSMYFENGVTTSPVQEVL